MAIDWSVIADSNFYKDASPEEKLEAERNYFSANDGKGLEGKEFEDGFKVWKSNATEAINARDTARSEDKPTAADGVIKNVLNTVGGPLSLVMQGADYLTGGEATRVANTAGANVVNIVPEVGNLAINAVTGNKNVIPTVKVEKPKTNAGEFVAEAAPYLIPVGGTAKGASAVGNIIAKSLSQSGKVGKKLASTGERFGRNAQQSVLGAAAGNDLSTVEGVSDAALDVGLGAVIGGGAEKVLESGLKAASKVVAPGNAKRIENAKNIIKGEEEAVKKVSDIEKEVEANLELANSLKGLDESKPIKDQFKPVYARAEDFLDDTSPLSDVKPSKVDANSPLPKGSSKGDTGELVGYEEIGNPNSFKSIEDYNKLTALGNKSVGEVKDALIKSHSTRNRLEDAIADVPTIRLSDIANFKGGGLLSPDTTKLGSSVLKELSKGSATAKLSNLTSTIGKFGDVGLLNRARELSYSTPSKAVQKSTLKELRDAERMFIQDGDTEGLALVKKYSNAIREGKKPNLTQDQVTDLNSKWNNLATRSADEVGEKVYMATGDSNDALKAMDDEVTRLSNTKPTESYRSGRAQAELYDKFTGNQDSSRNSVDLASIIASSAAGVATGGLSTLGQVGLVGAKEAADRAILNDIRRAAGQAVAGDAGRIAASERIATAVPSSTPVRAYVAGMDAMTDNSDVIDLSEEEFNSLISPSDNDEVIELSEDEFNSIQGGANNDIIELTEDEFYRASNPGEAYVGDKLYKGFQAAETGGLSNPWIRTMAQDKSSNLHSSAYGPAQVTYTLAQDYLTRFPNLFTDSEKDYLKRFVAQGKDFIAHSQGKHNDKRFAYGGEGVLNSDADKELYERVVKKMLVDTYRKNGESIVRTANAWRGLEDPAYNKKVIRNI